MGHNFKSKKSSIFNLIVPYGQDSDLIATSPGL